MEPAICIVDTASFRKTWARKIVVTGPMEPISETCPDPIMRIPADSMKTGNTVENIAMAMPSSYTRNGKCKAETGWVTPNWNSTAELATTMA